MNDKRGILTIAQGDKRFIRLAKNLAYSMDLNSPDIPKAVATDSDDPELLKLFDHVIPIHNQMPPGFIQKLNIYDFSPFEETLFIDSDSLVLDRLDFLFEIMKKYEVSAIGFTLQKGNWAGVEISDVIKFLNIPYLVIHNGGVYYFRKCQTAEDVFQGAKDLLSKYKEAGFYMLRGKIAHEPLMSSAMAMYNMGAVDDFNRGMRTPVDISSDFDMDILLKRCQFYEFDDERKRKVNPAIIHFSGSHADSFHYRRESLKLLIYKKTGLSKNVISRSLNILLNPFYILYIFSYRFIKFVIKGTRFKIKPLMPVLRYK